MRLSRLWMLLGFLPVVGLLAATVGCGGTSAPTSAGGPSPAVTTKAATSGEMKELASTGWGTLKGKVTLAGEAPIADLDAKIKDAIEKHQDKGTCLADDAKPEEKMQQVWRVKDGAVANVVVWLRPADGTFFKKNDADPAWAPKEPLKITQPHCAFIPHVATLFPSYYDPKASAKDKQHPTGQELIITNPAPMAHNTKWDGGAKNPGDNKTLQAGGEMKIDPKPNYSDPISINCDIHKWMSGYVWAFDHPYAAVTKEDGTYEIKNVPTGVEVKIVAWHEAPGFLDEKNKAKGEPITLKDGDNTKDFTVKAK
jgi:hypothetical protein